LDGGGDNKKLLHAVEREADGTLAATRKRVHR
jgi:hypothetical protein